MLAGEEAEAGKKRDPQGREGAPHLGGGRVVDRLAEVTDRRLRK